MAAALDCQTQRPVSGVLAGCVLVALMYATWARGEDDLRSQLLRLTEDCRKSRNLADGLIHVAPVVLPEGPNLLGTNDHFGWPVATMAGETLVVVFHRKPAHWGGSDKPDEHTSTAVTVRSTDGGETWSAPLDLKRCVKTKTEGCRLGFGNSIGLDPKGRVVVVTSYGVFRSADAGAIWEHLAGSFGDEQLAGPVCNSGPRLLLHPRHGLVAAGHPSRSGRENPDGTPYIAPELWLRTSADDGQTWQEQKVELPPFATAIEPTLLLHDGLLLVVARCHGRESHEPDRGTWRYVQLWSHRGWPPLEAKLTTMRTTGKPTGYSGPWSQDTVDLAFNPTTKRIEAVATNRVGGGPDNEQANVQTLNLWSISPEEIAGGQWRFETTLLTRDGGMWAGNNDGMHPGAAVIDAKRGVQHVFIYAGRPAGPSGIFRVTRTLDTPSLRTSQEVAQRG
jgi:hypothetical protein